MKIKAFFALSILVGISSGIFCQSYSFYVFPKQLPEKYKVDIAKEKEKLYGNEYPGVKRYRIKQFAEINANFKQDLMTSGDCYLNWDEPETYLNEILQNVLPDSLKNKGLKIYIMRDAEVNSFGIYDGTIFLNIGYLANVQEEAGLYFLVAHELAHYMYRDLEQNFINDEKLNKLKYRKDKDKRFELASKNASYSREQETRADSIGCAYLSKCGFSVKDFIPDFELLSELEEMYKASIFKNRHLSQTGTDGKTRIETTLDKLASHPETKLRIEKFNKWALKLDNTARNKKSSDKFLGFKQVVVYENLYLQSRTGDLVCCTENAFVQFILNPDDKYYQYFLIESLRQQIYLDPKFGEKTFIMCNYMGQNQKKSILSQLDFIFRDSAQLSIAKKSPFTQNTGSFLTNEQAFSYFSRFADKTGYSECYLTLALYNYQKNESAFNMYIDKYLSMNDCRYRTFAERLKNKKLDDFTGTKQLVMLDDINVYGVSENITRSKEMTFILYVKAKGTLQKKFPGYTFDLLLETEAEDMQKAITYRELMQSININNTRQYDLNKPKSSGEIYFNGASDSKNKEQEFDLFIYNPEFWTYMYENQLSSVNYIDMHYEKNTVWESQAYLCCNPIYLLVATIIYFPYLVAINNLQEDYIEGYIDSFDRNNKKKEGYFHADLLRQMSKKNYVKIIKRDLKGLAKK